MSISAGFTAEQIRKFVHEYELQPFGQKAVWLAGQGIAYDRFRRWRSAVYGGDLDRGLIPREGESMMIPPRQRHALERARAREREAQQAELERMRRRIKELEDTNDALGKAIGLLHWRNEQEPDAIGPTSDQWHSSSPSTPSSPN